MEEFLLSPYGQFVSWALPGVIGLIIGSFLNVVIHRVPRRESVVHPPSRCPSCEHRLEWWDNIPVLSYIALRGRCRKCRVAISFRYPTVELLTALLLIASRAKHGFDLSFFLRDIPLVSMLVAVTFIDLDHRIIPNVISIPGAFYGLLTAAIDWRLGTEPIFAFGLFESPESVALTAIIRALSGAALGFGFFYGLAWMYERMTGRAGLGGGDVKLLALIGAFLGPMGVMTTILISSVFGSVVGVSWAVYAKKKHMMTEAIPYGPFLVVGALYYSLFGALLI